MTLNFTQWFIIIFTGIAIIVDIVLCAMKKPTFSQEELRWYHRLPIVPFAVGVIFVGHFTQYFGRVPIHEAIKLTWLVLCSLSWLGWTIAMRVKPIQFTQRTFLWV